ncbi:24842_t:CDS:2 [Gigaspora margarita]|uniref:24842_t:CDS:1 n=1 Tax=Gigaspora margarita TaxID=4874 RepID=A0ABN7VTT9_GIGMA|nr:24842_t:CDS:2 [Gigaspora margarita]
MAVTFKRRLEKKVFNEHSIQSIATTILNITWALYGIGQAYEVFFTIKDIKSLSECVIEEQIPDETLVEEIETYHNTVIVEDIACVILLLLFAIAMACISYKLHQHFGWNNYKKIGGDPRLQIERLDGALSPTLPLPTVSLNNIWNRSGKEELDAVNGRWTIDD